MGKDRSASKIPTIRDVAQRAGVSAATVSHVINGTRFVSEETRHRVLAAMEALEYRPNALARSLRRNTTHTLGVIVPDNSSHFFAEMAHSIEEESWRRGYSVMLCNSRGDAQKEAAYIEVLLQRHVDGVVLVAAGESHEHLHRLVARHIPVVAIGYAIPELKIDAVLVGNVRGGLLATQHLLTLGHRRIACITGPAGAIPSLDRVAGYRQALKEWQVEPYEPWIVEGDFGFESGYLAAQRLLALAERPTAIFACNDSMAIGAMLAIGEAGLRVPDDLSVVGFDNTSITAYINPRLTTVEQPHRQMAEVGLALLAERIAEWERPVQQVLVDTRLVVRGSSGQAKTG